MSEEPSEQRMLTQEVTHSQWTLSHTGWVPSSGHRVKIPLFYIIYSDFEGTDTGN